MRKLRAVALGVVMAAGVASTGAADPYYAGKTLTIITGYAAGGGYSAYSQVIAKYLGRHIPGSPAVIATEMPGAGSIVAANYIYNVSKPDGLTIGSVNMFNMYSSYMSKSEGVHYDLSKMDFVGNIRSGNAIFLMRSDTYPNLEAIRKATRPIHLGYATKGDGHYIFGMAMDSGLGVHFQHIVGYGGGGGEIDLALERKEVDGRVANLNSYLLSRPDWIKNGFVKILSQEGVVDKDGNIARDSRIAGVPTMHELFPQNQTVEELMDFGSVGDLLAGVYIAPPKTPAALLTTLRTSFMATLNDPDFLADAEKFNLEITPMGPKEVEDIVDRALDVSPAVVDLVTDMMR